MKKYLLLTLGLLVSSMAFADNSATSKHNSNQNNQGQIASKPMYFDFGVGIGGATNWTSDPNVAINAMTMGFDVSKNLGVEIGVDSLPDGDNSGGQAMIMTYHLAAKGTIPFTDWFNLYGKAGLGINQYEGEVPSNNMNMANQVGFGLYTAAGMSFDLNDHFALYLEGSGVAVPTIGNNANAANGNFGSTYMATTGLEVTY